MKKLFFFIPALFFAFSNCFSQVTTMNDILQGAADIVQKSGAPSWALNGPSKEVFFKTSLENYKLQTYKDSLLFLQALNQNLGFTYNLKSRQMVTIDGSKSYGPKKLAGYVNIVKDLGPQKLDSLAKLQSSHWTESKAEYDLVISNLRQTIAICDSLGITNNQTLDLAKDLADNHFMNIQDEEVHLKFIKERLEELIAEEKKRK